MNEVYFYLTYKNHNVNQYRRYIKYKKMIRSIVCELLGSRHFPVRESAYYIVFYYHIPGGTICHLG